MVTEIINNTCSWLLGVNSAWLNQIRSVGYLNRSSDGVTITDDEVKEIGLTDIALNSAYVRFRNDENFGCTEIPSITSDPAYSYVFALRLVCLVKNDLAPIDVNLLLARQLNTYYLLEFSQVKNIRCKVVGGGSNTLSIVKNESGGDTSNVTYRAFYIDFNLRFDDYSSCDQINSINNIMPCNCTNTLDLPCVGSCDDITIELSEVVAGDYRVVTSFNGGRAEFTTTQEAGTEFTFNASNLNADYTFELQIFNPDGELVTKTVEAVEYDCFRVKIEP